MTKRIFIAIVAVFAGLTAWADGIIHCDLTQGSQTLTDLPNGTYRVSAAFKAWAKDDADGNSWLALCATPAGGNAGRTDNVADNTGFATYTLYVDVPGHTLTLSVQEDATRSYEVQDVQVEQVNASGHRADVSLACLYHDLSLLPHDLQEYDLTAPKYSAARHADLHTGGYIQQPNALIRAAAPICDENVIVDGVCPNLMLTDKAPFHNSTLFTATRATYQRTMGNQWGSIYLPYELRTGAGIQYYTFNRMVNAQSHYLLFADADRLPAYTPGLFVNRTGSTNVTLASTDVAVPPTPAAFPHTHGTDDGWTVVGTTEALSLPSASIPGGLYYLTSNTLSWSLGGSVPTQPTPREITDNTFQRASSTLTVSSFRLYLSASPDIANQTRSFTPMLESECGNVNNDGKVSISDLPAFIDLRLHGNASKRYNEAHANTLPGTTDTEQAESLAERIMRK